MLETSGGSSKRTRWPRYQHIIFDCDSTLSSVEGIDELADQEQQRRRISALTDAAMDGEIPLQEVYGERLRILQPTRGEVRLLRAHYKKHVVEDAAALIEHLRTLGHEIYIVSGGLLDPVREFGISLGVDADNIRAVDVEYDALSGDWWRSKPADWDQQYLAYAHSALSESHGKSRIIAELLDGKQGTSMLVGDGVSDLLASPGVDLFVGYGGVITRERVAAEAPAFLRSASLSPLLLLASGAAGARQLEGQASTEFVAKAYKLLEDGALAFNEPSLRGRFLNSL